MPSSRDLRFASLCAACVGSFASFVGAAAPAVASFLVATVAAGALVVGGFEGSSDHDERGTDGRRSDGTHGHGTVRSPRNDERERRTLDRSTDERGRRTLDRSNGESTPRRTDTALETLRRRYAAGELTDGQFERKLERLLATETVEDAEEYADGD